MIKVLKNSGAGIGDSAPTSAKSGLSASVGKFLPCDRILPAVEFRVSPLAPGEKVTLSTDCPPILAKKACVVLGIE